MNLPAGISLILNWELHDPQVKYGTWWINVYAIWQIKLGQKKNPKKTLILSERIIEYI